MSLEPHEPREVAGQGQGLGYPTAEAPTYRKVEAHPDPAQPITPWPGSTGELPVAGGPAPVVPDSLRGPYVPTIVRGLFVLVVAAVVFVWRLADDPNWAVVGITLAVVAGAVLLLAAVTSLVIRRIQRERNFDRMLSGS